MDENDHILLFASVNPNESSITIPTDILDTAESIYGTNFTKWHVITISYDANGMNYARGYSEYKIHDTEDDGDKNSNFYGTYNAILIIDGDCPEYPEEYSWTLYIGEDLSKRAEGSPSETGFAYWYIPIEGNIYSYFEDENEPDLVSSKTTILENKLILDEAWEESANQLVFTFSDDYSSFTITGWNTEYHPERECERNIIYSGSGMKSLPEDEKLRRILSGEDQEIDITSDSIIIGTGAKETLNIDPDINVDLTAGDGDQVNLPYDLAHYEITSIGNHIFFSDVAANKVVTIIVTGTSTVGFADGKTATLEMVFLPGGPPQVQLGGAVVGSTLLNHGEVEYLF